MWNLQRLDGVVDNFDGENADNSCLKPPEDDGRGHADRDQQDPERQPPRVRYRNRLTDQRQQNRSRRRRKINLFGLVVNPPTLQVERDGEDEHHDGDDEPKELLEDVGEGRPRNRFCGDLHEKSIVHDEEAGGEVNNLKQVLINFYYTDE